MAAEGCIAFDAVKLENDGRTGGGGAPAGMGGNRPGSAAGLGAQEALEDIGGPLHLTLLRAHDDYGA